MSIRAESGRCLKFVARTFELATLSRRHLPSSLTVSPLFPHLPSPFPLPSPLRSSPPPREPSKTTVPTGTHTIASSRAKLSFSFSFSFGLLMSNNFQVFCSRATPASPWTWPPRPQAMRRHDVASPTAYDRSPPRPTPRGSLARTPRPRVPRPSAPHPLPHPPHAVPRCTQVSAAPFCELCPTTDTLPG